MALIEIRDFRTWFKTERGTARAVDAVDFTIEAHRALGVIASMADDVVVMVLGKVVERAPVRAISHRPMHPCTRGLTASLPSLIATDRTRLDPIKGAVPDRIDAAPGCGFAPRCPHAVAACHRVRPALLDVAPGHEAACHLFDRSVDAGPAQAGTGNA